MFGFPIAEKPVDLKFDKTFLQTVVFQVQFAKNDVLCSKDTIEALKAKFQPSFKNVKERISQELQLRFEEQTPTISTSTEGKIIGTEFRNDSNTEMVVITNDSIVYTIAGGNYTHFLDYEEKMNEIFSEVLTTYGITKVSRIAIRKTNVFELYPKEDAKDQIDRLNILQLVFNTALVENLTYFPASQEIDTHINSTTFKNGGKNLILKYGLLPPSIKPNLVQLLLDIDLFTLEDIATNNIYETLKLINSEIYNIFRWSIQNDVVKYLLTS